MSSRIWRLVCNGSNVVMVAGLVYLERKSSYSPPFIPVPLPGPSLSPSPLYLVVSPLPHPHSLANPRSLTLLDLSSSDVGSMDINVDMVLGPIVLAVVFNASSLSRFFWVFRDAEWFFYSYRLCCTGRVLCSGTRTGPLGSRIPGTPSELLPPPSMSVSLPLGIDLITSPFSRALIYCTYSLGRRIYAHVQSSVPNPRIPDLFSIS